MMGRILSSARGFVAAATLAFAVPVSVQAQSVDEAALRLSLMLSREVDCAASDPFFSVAAVPAEDASQTLDAQILTRIERLILDALRRDALNCVRITEVERAFDTLAYVQNLVF